MPEEVDKPLTLGFLAQCPCIKYVTIELIWTVTMSELEKNKLL